jgi:hypothetical protein
VVSKSSIFQALWKLPKPKISTFPKAPSLRGLLLWEKVFKNDFMVLTNAFWCAKLIRKKKGIRSHITIGRQTEEGMNDVKKT